MGILGDGECELPARLAQHDFKEQTERRLHNTQLCTFFLIHRRKRQGCNFAHPLEDLRPPPSGFSKFEGHFYEAGQPKSSNGGVAQCLLAVSEGEGPAWCIHA